MFGEKLFDLRSGHENIEVSSELALTMAFVLLRLLVYNALQGLLFLLLEDGCLLLL